jgi:hypothetical protein
VSIRCESNGYNCVALNKTYTYETQLSYMATNKNVQNREYATKLENAAELFTKTI